MLVTLFLNVHYFLSFFLKRSGMESMRLKLLMCSGFEKDNRNNRSVLYNSYYILLYIDYLLFFYSKYHFFYHRWYCMGGRERVGGLSL